MSETRLNFIDFLGLKQKYRKTNHGRGVRGNVCEADDIREENCDAFEAFGDDLCDGEEEM